VRVRRGRMREGRVGDEEIYDACFEGTRRPSPFPRIQPRRSNGPVFTKIVDSAVALGTSPKVR
jgi:hypothetical protein